MHKNLRNFLIGLAGFILAGITANLATFLIFRINLLNWILRLVPQDQPLLHLLVGIGLAFLGVGLSGALGGLLRGETLHRIDPLGGRRRYLWGSAVSAGITQGLLVIPALLIISLVSLYNNGSAKDPLSFVALFGALGGLFGLVGGLLLALLTARLRFAWLPWLANTVGGLAGGLLVGLILWRPESITSGENRLQAALVTLVLVGAAINAAMGGLQGLAYTWVNARRVQFGSAAVSPRRWQDVATFAVGSLVFVLLMSFIGQIANFVTVYPGSTSTSLEPLTQGVDWLAPVVVDPAAVSGSAPAIVASPAGLRAAWSSQVDDSGGVSAIVYAYQAPADGAPAWSEPMVVSNSPQVESLHPQLAAAQDGTVYIVWDEGGKILVSRCSQEGCSTPRQLSAQAAACPEAQTPRAWPAVAVDPGGEVLAAWSAGPGQIEYALWDGSTAGVISQSGCLQLEGESEMQPRLAAGAVGNWQMAVSVGGDQPDQPIYHLELQAGVWSQPESPGSGSGVEIFAAQGGEVHLAWCAADGRVMVFTSAAISPTSPQIAAAAGCRGRPTLAADAEGWLHLIFRTSELVDNYGASRPTDRLVEVSQLAAGWSPPLMIYGINPPEQPAAAAASDGSLHLLAAEAGNSEALLKYTQQPIYQCRADDLLPAFRAMLEVIENGEFHPTGYQSPYCANDYIGMVHMPGPLANIEFLPNEEKDGFDDVADIIKKARQEVLISNMQWDPDSGGYSPGYRLTSAVGELYRQVKAHPEAYPRGMTVRILLGNYPNLATLQYGDQIWGVIQGLARAGVEKMEDPEIGWKVEVANYAGAYPHSHTKFVVVDGENVLGAGFNIAWLHLPKDDPSGKGDSLTDLGLLLSGPVAQTAMTVFDDEWQGANQLFCPLLDPENLDQKQCEWRIAQVSHSPDVLRFHLPGGDDTALAIYRTATYKEADAAYTAALSAAQTSIDAMHVNFSAELICMVNLFMDDVCTYENTLEYMHSLVAAMENGAHVRVIVENANSNGMENRVAYQILMDELVRRGLSDQFELRFFNGRLHMKSSLIDNELLIVGSQNFHYSSFGAGGLLEFNLTTTSPQAIETYQRMFETYWEQAIPFDQAQWGDTGG